MKVKNFFDRAQFGYVRQANSYKNKEKESKNKGMNMLVLLFLEENNLN